MDILVNVANQKLKIATNLKSLVAGTQEFVRFVFNLTGDWDNLMTFAQFRQNGVAYNQYLDENNSAYLPAEIETGTCTLMLYGSNENTIATTNYLTLVIDDNILVGDAQSTEITQSLYNQLVAMVDALSNRVSDFENSEVITEAIEQAVTEELLRYLNSGALADLAIEDGSLTREKVDGDFEETLDKADSAMQPSVYDTNGIRTDIYSYVDLKASPNNIIGMNNYLSDRLTQMFTKPMWLIYTDLHNITVGGVNISKVNMERIEQFYNSIPGGYRSTTDAIFLGDAVDTISEFPTLPYKDNLLWKKTLKVVGNHDCTTVGAAATADATDVYNAVLGDDARSWGVIQPENAASLGKNYYYKDYPATNSKVRLIVIDGYYYTTEQRSWFADVLESARINNLAVIVAKHEDICLPEEKQPINADYPFGSLKNKFDGIQCRTYDNHTILPNGYILQRNAVDSFVANGGKFVCWINGHTHDDRSGYYQDTHSKQLSLTFRDAGTANESAVRVNGFSQDCFNFISVDTTNKYLFVLRVGQKTDKWGHTNDYLVYDYDNGKVVEYQVGQESYNELNEKISTKYTKPPEGISKQDLSMDLQSEFNKAEIINTVTLTNPQYEISFVTDSDNNSINLNFACVTVYCPVAETTETVWVDFYADILGDDKIVRLSPASVMHNSNTMYSYIMLDNVHGLYVPFARVPSAYDYSASNVLTNAKLMLATKPIRSVQLRPTTSTSKFPAGTIVTLYGVRA